MKFKQLIAEAPGLQPQNRVRICSKFGYFVNHKQFAQNDRKCISDSRQKLLYQENGKMNINSEHLIFRTNMRENWPEDNSKA